MLLLQNFMFENLIMMPYSSIKVSINLLKTKDIKINEIYIYLEQNRSKCMYVILYIWIKSLNDIYDSLD